MGRDNHGNGNAKNLKGFGDKCAQSDRLNVDCHSLCPSFVQASDACFVLYLTCTCGS